MIELGAVTRALLAIARDLRDDRVLAEQICLACVAGLDVDGAAISVLTTSTMRETLWASDATAELLEDLQFSLGEGACIEAAVTARPVLVPDLSDPAETSRWPIYAAAVVEQAGVGAVFALPLQWGAITVGVLDLYRRAPGSLSEEQSRDALSAADAATLMLLGLRTDPGEDLAWDRSWSNRAEIHQATGMVVAQLEISATDAFARLRAYAFAEQRQLGDVARDVVARRLHFSKDT
jgi:transcriptional regulator with GAF, ATPase, and Fis domain